MSTAEIVECLNNMASKIEELRRLLISGSAIIGDFVIDEDVEVTVLVGDKKICVVSPKEKRWRMGITKIQ